MKLLGFQLGFVFKPRIAVIGKTCKVLSRIHRFNPENSAITLLMFLVFLVFSQMPYCTEPDVADITVEDRKK